MARSRLLKPGFFKNEDLAECGMTARVLFAGLWCFADREGRLEDRPKRIKAEIFPYDMDIDVEQALNCLIKHGFVLRYQIEDKTFLQVINFNKHQHPHHKELISTIPSPDLSRAELGQDPDLSRAEPHPNPSLTLNPLTLTLNPSNPLVGLSPDIVELKSEKKASLQNQARDILTFLNTKTGKRYQPVKANVDIVVARLKEGATVTQCRQVIVRKGREWQTDETMAKYLRPATLFNRTKFWQYAGELVPEGTQHG